MLKIKSFASETYNDAACNIKSLVIINDKSEIVYKFRFIDDGSGDLEVIKGNVVKQYGVE